MAQRFLCDLGTASRAGVGRIVAALGAILKFTPTDAVSLRTVKNGLREVVCDDKHRVRAKRRPTTILGDKDHEISRPKIRKYLWRSSRTSPMHYFCV